MKKEEVIKGGRYISNSNPSLIVIATGAVDDKVKSFQGQETSQGGIGDWYLKEFSPLSEKEYEAPRSIPNNEVKEERLESALKEISKLLNYKYISSITFDKHIKVKFTFIHNKIKFDSLQALQDTLNHLHDLNQDA